MSGNHLKTPFAYSANALAQQRATHVAALLGKGLPCQVTEVLIGFVTVSFEVNSIFNIPNLTIPMVMTQYGRPPIQIGDLGRAVPTGVSLAAVSGISTATPNLGLEGNLATLAFEPLGNKTWSAVGGDGEAYVLYGVNGGGVIMQDSATGSATTVTINKNSVTIEVGSGKPVNITAGGSLSPVMTQAGPSPVLLADG